MNGDSWRVVFDPKLAPCFFEGVICDGDKRVVALNLQDNHVIGTFSSAMEHITQMANLKHLTLSMNNIQGSLPDSFGGLKSLESLSLSDTGIQGSLPQSLINLPNLKFLDISMTQWFPASLQGRIVQNFPENLFRAGSKLQKVYLSNNQITGTIPKSILQMSSLRVFNLAENKLTGTIPGGDYSKLNQLEVFDVSSNGLTGALPGSFAKAPILTQLLVRDNSLTNIEAPLKGGTRGLMVFSCTGNVGLSNEPCANPDYLGH